MLQSFYNAALGAQQEMDRLNVHANNIANVNTHGYRAEVPNFQALMYGMVNGIDGAQLPKGAGTYMVTTTTNYTSDALEQTGRKQDYAIEGDGFFALYEPGTGQVSYTRDGAFTIGEFIETDEEGQPQSVWYLTDGEGRQVLNREGYPIVVTDPNAEQPVGVFLVQYQDGMEHLDSSRFLAGDKNGVIWISPAKVHQGYLETSNVNLAGEIGKVIESQRAYSYALKMVQTADEVENTVIGLTNG